MASHSERGFYLLKSNLVGNATSFLNFLTPAECKSLIDSGESSLELRAGVTDDRQVHENLRRSDIGWFAANGEHKWLFDRIRDAINQVNTSSFGYNLIGFEGIQFTKYSHRTTEESDFYSSHKDTIVLPGGTIRKLSFTIQLSEPESYGGGDLVLYESLTDSIPLTRALGSISFFPSYTIHEVLPVTRAVRYSLVGWAHGPAFV